MEKWVKTGGNRYTVAEVGGFLALGRGSKGPQLATTIVSSSTTLAPTPCRQRLTTVGGWCDTIIQPFLSRFSAVSHPGVSVLRRFCGTKTPGWQNLVFWAKNQQRTHHKVGTARPPKAIHTAIYAKGACPYTHRATHNRHTECAGLPWWSFGSRCARIVRRGSPIRFVPSVWYKRQKLLKFEHVHAKLTMTPDAPPGDTVVGA